jgi:hypothetical protein
MKKKIYALYKGDKWLLDGIKQELADYLKVKIRTIDFYMSKTYEKRTDGNSYKVIFIGVE